MAAKPVAPSGRHKARGGGQRPDPDANAAAQAPRCWQSGSKPKETSAADLVANTPATATSPNAQKGWGELPAAERASRCAQLQEMGFSAGASHRALEECAWDVNKALDDLFNGRSNFDDSNDRSGVTKHPQTITPSKQPSSQRIGVRTQKASTQAAAYNTKTLPQAKARNMDDSTSASGGSTPRLPSSMSPQRDYSCASSASDSITSQEKSPSLPPGLEEMQTLLAVPPGLHDEPTPSANILKALESSSPPVFQVPGIAVPVAGAAPTGAVSVVPKRKLQKVQHTWQCEDSTSQLSIEEDTFVYVWSDSKTESGWIYAESLICCNRAGWLPESMLQQLPVGRLWMRVSTTCHATHPMQLQVEAGNMVLVDASHDPVNGWVYAEQVASATGRPSLQGLIGAGGWVPIQCIKWAEV